MITITKQYIVLYDTIQDEQISENFATLATRPRQQYTHSTNQKTTSSACPCRSSSLWLAASYRVAKPATKEMHATPHLD